MAIDRPQAIDDAPACRPEQSGGGGRAAFLPREGWRFAPAEESCLAAIAAEAIEASAVLRPDQTIKRRRGRVRYPARVKPKLDAVAAFIDQVLDEDRRAPRKQRHTARRIYRRLLTEFPDAAVAESTVPNHVRARKRALGLVKRETFVPQS